jgi:hypothetical protein
MRMPTTLSGHSLLLIPMLLACSVEKPVSIEEEETKARDEKASQVAQKVPVLEVLRASWEEKKALGAVPSFNEMQIRREMYQTYQLEHLLYEVPKAAGNEVEDTFVYEESECEQAGNAAQTTFTYDGDVLNVVSNGKYECAFMGTWEPTRYIVKDLNSFEECELEGAKTECRLVISESYALSTVKCEGADFSGVTMEAFNASDFFSRFCGESKLVTVKASFDNKVSERTRRLALITDKAGCTNASTDPACFEQKETYSQGQYLGLAQTSDNKPCEAKIASGFAEYGPCIHLTHLQSKHEGFSPGERLPENIFHEISFPALKSKIVDKWYYGNGKATLKINDWSGEVSFDATSSAIAPTYRMANGIDAIEGRIDIEISCYGTDATSAAANCPQ